MTSHAFLKITLVGLFILSSEMKSADLPPSAPVPPQILSAKKVFISNASDDCFGTSWTNSGCVRGQFYNDFYTAMKSWGRYELTSSPADADLVFELSLAAIWLPNGDKAPPLDSHYKLSIIDARTHFVLWAFIEHAELAMLSSNTRKNHILARAQIVTDLKVLNAQAESQTK